MWVELKINILLTTLMWNVSKSFMCILRSETNAFVLFLGPLRVLKILSFFFILAMCLSCIYFLAKILASQGDKTSFKASHDNDNKQELEF